MRALEQLDYWITEKVKSWSSRVSGVPRTREILEIWRDILEDVRDHIQPKGQGTRVFPYNTISIRIAAANREQRELLEAAFSEEGVEKDVRGLLSEADCPVPSGLTVGVSAFEDAALALSGHPFVAAYSNAKGAAASKLSRNSRPRAKLTILRGEAEVVEYAIQADRVNIGRLKEVIGDKDGLRRRNDIAFADTETTVSREHAYIRYDAESGKFRLYDSLSQRGTSVFREGRRFEVPKGVTHGFQLRPGDEIHVGDARIAFESED
ncbi:MAG: FHA domain-containing protein [Bryobacteraceae bacterium]